MKPLLAMIFALLSWPALAQDIFPALHDVTGVAADDVLNVRAAPSAGSAIIGTFAPHETGIEVIALSDDGGWGRVNAGEQSGWASMRFLARQPGQTAADWAAGLAPLTVECFGTEPFWSLTLVPGGRLTYAGLDIADSGAQSGGYEALASSASSGKRGFVGWLDASPIEFIGIGQTRVCSDGMSDRLYGFSIDLVRERPTGIRLYSGCCRFVP